MVDNKYEDKIFDRVKTLYNGFDNFISVLCKKQKKTEDNEYGYWPLCLDDQRAVVECDICATSQAVSLMSLYMQNYSRTKERTDEKIKTALPLALHTLVFARGKNKLWPSSVEMKNLKVEEGLVAVCDTGYALTALLDAGFLQEDFGVSIKGLKELDARKEFFFESLAEIIKLQDNQGGWRYVNAEDKKVATMPTLKIVELLMRILNDYGSILTKEQTDEIVRAINPSIEKLQDSLCESRYIDNFLRSDDESVTENASLLHTCKLLEILIRVYSLKNTYTDLNDFTSIEFKSVKKWVLEDLAKDVNICGKNGRELCLTEIYKKQLNYKFFGERYVVSNKKIQQAVLHESYTEGIVLQLFAVLLERYENNIESICVPAMGFVDMLLNLRHSNNGAFKGHAVRAEGSYPVYADYEAYKAILALYACFAKRLEKPDNSGNDNKSELKAEIKAFSDKLLSYGMEHRGEEFYAEAVKSADNYRNQIKGIYKEVDNDNSDCGKLRKEFEELQQRINEELFKI